MLTGNFVKDYLENDIMSLKKFWEKINYLLPSTSSGNSIQLIDKGNNTPVTVEQTPNFINEFFTNIGPNLDRNVDGQITLAYS